MPTLFIVGAYRIVVYLNDHEPAHVHVIGPAGTARIALGETPDDVALLEVQGIGKGDMRRIAAAIIDRHAECLEGWAKCHGD